MDKSLKLFLLKSIGILLLIHLGYFLYGYYTFKGIAALSIYTELYRFKFYDAVSISHFFITGLFLLFFLILLLKKHSKQIFSWGHLFKTGGLFLLVSFLSFSFFISYSFGMNAQLKSELSENDFNKDKTLLNILNPFLYESAAYHSEELFDPTNILYPKPYPVIEVVDSTLMADQYYQVDYKYYSIDTLKMLTSDLNKVSNVTNKVLEHIGLDQSELTARIIKKNVVKDSTEIIYKGFEVHPAYDNEICIFIENKSLYSPVKGIPIEKQQYAAAVKRYQLLYNPKPDSLFAYLQQFNALLKKYNVESQIAPQNLVQELYEYKNNRERSVYISNNFDRASLADKFTSINSLFYNPHYLHPSIAPIFFSLVFGIWLLGWALYLLVCKRNRQRAVS